MVFVMMGLDGLQNLLIGWPSSSPSKQLKKALKVSKGLFSLSSLVRFSQLKAKKS